MIYMAAGIWQKRFKKKINRRILDFTSSVSDDVRLIPHDITASIAHAKMLDKEGWLTRQELKEIVQTLNNILKAYKKGNYQLDADYEDVHMNIENSLRKISPDLADKLHTARSRNDLVATDLRLYSLNSVKQVIQLLVNLQSIVLTKAENERHCIIPGYTHI